MKLNLFIFAFVVLIDQVSKRYLLSNIPLGDSKEFLPGVMSLTMAQNTGGAFSVFREYPMLFMIIGIANLLIFSYVCFCPTVKLSNSMKTGCAFILGGTLGNLIDRVTNGAVIDFFNLEFVDFAIFNFADVAINIGVIIILAGLFPVRKKQLIKGN